MSDAPKPSQGAAQSGSPDGKKQANKVPNRFHNSMERTAAVTDRWEFIARLTGEDSTEQDAVPESAFASRPGPTASMMSMVELQNRLVQKLLQSEKETAAPKKAKWTETRKPQKRSFPKSSDN